MTFSITRLLPLFTLAALLCLSGSAYADDTIYTKVDENPSPTLTPPPAYPEKMREQNITGVVAVSIVIDESGTVTSSSVVKSTNPEFEQPALDAIAKWKFKPGKKDGKAVKVKVTVPMRFNLKE
jgi:periplasmic protein TonB